ncbi:MAG: DNA alkylation repair protein [Ignavibacteriales bacterium]|nr:DNA alkylation repair protein [Ignavibacteriales bacterium]
MTTSSVLQYLKKHGTRSNIEKMKYFGIESPKAFGVNAPTLRTLAKRIGTDHTLALSLWKTGYHEARILAALIADPQKVTERLMERWVNDFNSWAICDACCGELFDYTPFAIGKAYEWSTREKQYVKRAGFVMMAALSVHRKELDDNIFKKFFPVIERESIDRRNFVRKAVNWALRQIGKRNIRLHGEAMKIAVKLSKQKDSTARWIGTDAIKDLQSEPVRRKFARMKVKM